MMSDPLFTKLLLVVLIWLCVTLHLVWPSEPPAAQRRNTSQRRHRASAPMIVRPDKTGALAIRSTGLKDVQSNRFKSS